MTVYKDDQWLCCHLVTEWNFTLFPQNCPTCRLKTSWSCRTKSEPKFTMRSLVATARNPRPARRNDWTRTGDPSLKTLPDLSALQPFTSCSCSFYVCDFRPMEISAKRPAPFLRQVVATRKPVSGGSLWSWVCFQKLSLNDCVSSDAERSSIWRLVGRIQAGDLWEDVQIHWQHQTEREGGEEQTQFFGVSWAVVDAIGLKMKLHGVFPQVVQKQLKRKKMSNEKKEKLQFLLKRMVSLAASVCSRSHLLPSNQKNRRESLFKCVCDLWPAGEPGAGEEEPRAAERKRVAVQEAAERASQSGSSTLLP